MEYVPDNSDMVQGALSMVRIPGAAMSPETAEVAQIVRLVLSGDTSSFEHIISRYERRVMNIAIRILGCRDDAHDAAQEVFLRVFKYLHRLDLEKPIDPWLMRMTVNVCRDLGRKKRQHQSTSLEQTSSEAAQTVQPTIRTLDWRKSSSVRCFGKPWRAFPKTNASPLCSVTLKASRLPKWPPFLNRRKSPYVPASAEAD